MIQCPEEFKASAITGFVYWYNEISRHNALRSVTPCQRYCCENIIILKQHRALYESDEAQHPESWPGPTHR